jgi:hypothetical protein
VNIFGILLRKVRREKYGCSACRSFKESKLLLLLMDLNVGDN